MKNGFLRVASAAPSLVLCDPLSNARHAAQIAETAEKEGARVLVFPEMYLTGKTAGDALFLSPLLRDCELALSDFMKATSSLPLLSLIGLPISLGSKLYNAIAAVSGGKLLALIPKAAVGSDTRYFARQEGDAVSVSYAGQTTLFGKKLLLQAEEMEGLSVAAVFGDELSSLSSPLPDYARCGATLFAVCAASPELVGRAECRRLAILEASRHTKSAVILSESSRGESGTDFVFGGHRLIAEGGDLLAEALPFSHDELLFATLDLEALLYDRRRDPAFTAEKADFAEIRFSLPLSLTATPKRSKAPFVPTDEGERNARLSLLLTMQAEALSARLMRSHAKTLVLGLSGGLDSTLAILVAARACDLLSIPRQSILAVTMPGFGTTGRTRGNAEKLADALGATLKTIPIGAAVMQHFSDIGHDPSRLDVVYENAQARERTQILMDLANGCSGLVVGTGDLSELALGFATYNGDHMSNYGVNAGIPKTLLRHLVAFAAEESRLSGDDDTADVLLDILETPVSPELLPPENGEIAQKTEGIVGPYELHDFFLYYTVRYGFSPKKILRLAVAAFLGDYTRDTILSWLRVFFRRFLSQQFKRSCLPDGPKVGAVGFSPRGDFCMPSDLSPLIFEKELSEL